MDPVEAFFFLYYCISHKKKKKEKLNKKKQNLYVIYVVFICRETDVESEGARVCTACPGFCVFQPSYMKLCYCMMTVDSVFTGFVTTALFSELFTENVLFLFFYLKFIDNHI